MGMVARIQILPGGIIIGHTVPITHPVNGILEMKENHVYELRTEQYFGDNTFHDIGKADYTSESTGSKNGVSIDKFLALCQGNHLTVNTGK